jgi:hypothetical protein
MHFVSIASSNFCMILQLHGNACPEHKYIDMLLARKNIILILTDNADTFRSLHEYKKAHFSTRTVSPSE